MKPIKKILVPIDVADDAGAPVALAAKLAKQFGASIDLFHVWPQPPMLPLQLLVVPEPGGPPVAAFDVAKSMAQARLREIAARLRADGISETQCRVGVGDPGNDIVDLAQVGGFDLIVMGTHRRGALAHALLGSVAEKVVRNAPCPVLTTRAES